MPRRRGLDRHPRDYVVTGAWPDGDLPADAPSEVAALRQLVVNLRSAMAGRSARQVADDAGVPHSTVVALLAGRRFPDFVTVHRLERAVGPLWPR